MVEKPPGFKDCIFSKYIARGSVTTNISLGENSQGMNGPGLKSLNPTEGMRGWCRIS